MASKALDDVMNIVEALHADVEAQATIDKATWTKIDALLAEYKEEYKNCTTQAEHKAAFNKCFDPLWELVGKDKMNATTTGLREKAARDKFDLVAKPNQRWLGRRYGKCTTETVLDAFTSAIPKDQAVAISIETPKGFCGPHVSGFSVIAPDDFAPIASKLPGLTEAEFSEMIGAISSTIALPTALVPLAYVCCLPTCCSTGGCGNEPWCGMGCCGETFMESKLALAVSEAQEKLAGKGLKIEAKKIRVRLGGTDKEFEIKNNGATQYEHITIDYNAHFLFVYMGESPAPPVVVATPVPMEIGRA
jgi:hypothetical protein